VATLEPLSLSSTGDVSSAALLDSVMVVYFTFVVSLGGRYDKEISERYRWDIYS
jgi:hypothetical protein